MVDKLGRKEKKIQLRSSLVLNSCKTKFPVFLLPIALKHRCWHSAICWCLELQSLNTRFMFALPWPVLLTLGTHSLCPYFVSSTILDVRSTRKHGRSFVCLGWSESWYKSESSQEISKMHTPGLCKDFELMGLRRVPGTWFSTKFPGDSQAGGPTNHILRKTNNREVYSGIILKYSPVNATS